MAVGVNELFGQPIGVDLSRHDLADVEDVGLEVFRCGQLLPVQLFEVVLGVSEEMTQRGVHLLEPSLRGGQAHADGGVVDRTAIALVGLGLEPAGFLGRLLGSHLVISQTQRRGEAVLAALCVVERLGVQVDPVHNTIDSDHAHAFLEGTARVEDRESGSMVRGVLVRNNVSHGTAQPILGRGTQNAFDRW